MHQRQHKEIILHRLLRFAAQQHRFGIIFGATLCLAIVIAIYGVTTKNELVMGLATVTMFLCLSTIIVFHRLWFETGSRFRSSTEYEANDLVGELDVARVFSQRLQQTRVTTSLICIAGLLLIAGDALITRLPDYILGAGIGLASVSMLLLFTCLFWQLKTSLYLNDLVNYLD